MTPHENIQVIAEAEKILNRTLAYQAAIAVHEVKDRLNVDVSELRLVVAPITEESLGSYRVTCTIAGLAQRQSLTVERAVRPEHIVARSDDGKVQATGK